MVEPRVRFVADQPDDDRVIPFQVDGLDARGRIIRLGPALDTILRRHDYPASVSRLLGEAIALTALLGTSLKFEGTFQLQTRTDGAVDILVVDFEAPGKMRAYARFNADKIAALGASPDPAALLGKGHMGLTIDRGPHMQRYQGLVPLEGQGLEDAAHQYFARSEQIPTRVRLAVAEEFSGGASRWRAGGILIQYLPHSIDRQREEAEAENAPMPEQRSGDEEPDVWAEARALVDTVEDHELIDPALSSERLLYRLFHERGVRVFEPTEMVEKCRCSSARILEMLRRFTPEEKRAMVGDNGQIGVTCEFCSTHYAFTPDEIDQPEAR